ncbi:hypothetical protein GGX14DRAFT_400411 [Mycena pura]|uniref:Uncharacterized protein n=1 Tax=Mycena pura TaxID=153505 RepID=A0AAD6Y4E4_9AGAR|nr:hypothetical protein GGX14DRAFT_400411 [Mycena pura]
MSTVSRSARTPSTGTRLTDRIIKIDRVLYRQRGNHAGQPKPAQTTAPEVVLSTGALATLMKEQHKLLQTVMHTALAETHRYAPRVYRDQGYHRGPGAGSFRHRFDRGNQRRGGHSLAERVNTKPRGKRAGVAHRRNRKNNDEVMVPEAVPGVSDSVDTQPRVETPTEPVHNESVKLEDGEVNMGSNDEIDSLFNDFGLDSEDSGMNMANSSINGKRQEQRNYHANPPMWFLKPPVEN